jgi:ABC-type sugar transport system ATPase subunit
MKGPLEAKANGVVFIHQELSLAKEMTVAENIYLGELAAQALRPRRLGHALSTRPTRSSKSSRWASMPARLSGDLSIANQQMVEIARALTVTPRP